MFEVGSVVKDDTGSAERFVVVQIHFFDSTTSYDIQSLSDRFVYLSIAEDRLSLAANQDLSGAEAYDRAMRGI